MSSSSSSVSVRPLALITGASAGLGVEFAHQLAARGHDLLLTARRADRLRSLADTLTARYAVHCHVVVADLADPAAPAALENEVRTLGRPLAVLVNNAGYGVPGSYLGQTWQVHADFLQVMVTAVAELCHRFLPGMRNAGTGLVINVSSLAGHMPATAGHTLYGPVKAWLVRFSESLADEMQPHGVRVLALCPGFTYTEFHDANGMRPHVSRLPRWLWMDAASVVGAGLTAAARGDWICIPGRINRSLALAARLLPAGLLRRLVASRAADFRKVD